jgi:acetylornithine deacetylase/succinyl-diaminopimelate desuccinylase-like protein
MVGSTGHAKVADFLVKKIRDLDKDIKNVVYIEDFKPDIDYAKKLYEKDFKEEIEDVYQKTNPLYKKWRGFTDSMLGALEKRRGLKGRNVVWEKKGNLAPNELIIIGAHYDTIANDPKTLLIQEEANMPGADDNGSGVAVSLSLIQILSKMDLPKTVRVVFFDWEELGFLGSRAYVSQHLKEFKDKKFLGYINLEMLGNDSKVNDKEKRYGNMKLYIRKKGAAGHELDKRFAERLLPMGKKAQPSIKFELLANSFKSSDHASFWNKGLAAVTFTQNWESDFNRSRYHTSNDFVETVNARTLYRAYTFIGGAVGALAFDFLP